MQIGCNFARIVMLFTLFIYERFQVLHFPIPDFGDYA